MSNIKNKFLDTYRKIKRIFFRKYAFDAIPYSIADMKKFKKHPTTLICEGVLVRNFSADVEIGENSQIGPYTVIFSGTKGVIIGKNVLIAPHVVISGGNHNYKNIEKPMRFSEGFSDGPIIIKDGVLIGANVTITDGVIIEEEAVIAANSVVTQDVMSYDVVGGIPARKLFNRKDFFFEKGQNV